MIAIIEIPDHYKNIPQDYYNLSDAVRNGTILPDNATNGEMVQKFFNCEVCEPIIEDDIIHVIFADKKDSAIGFDWSWWNSPYRKETDNVN